jgi:hypothetical protein
MIQAPGSRSTSKHTERKYMCSIIGVFTCCQCKDKFDEFEFNYKAHKVDGFIMCNLCRKTLGLQYSRSQERRKIYNVYGKTGKPYNCILCGEVIKKGSKDVQYRVENGKRKYMHLDCPEWKQVKLELTTFGE